MIVAVERRRLFVVGRDSIRWAVASGWMKVAVGIDVAVVGRDSIRLAVVAGSWMIVAVG